MQLCFRIKGTLCNINVYVLILLALTEYVAKQFWYYYIQNLLKLIKQSFPLPSITQPMNCQQAHA